MKKVLALMLLLIPVASLASTEVELRAGAGEWGNTNHTERYSVEATHYQDNWFVRARGELQDHPFDDVVNQAKAGAGIIIGDFYPSVIANDERYRVDITYRAPTDGRLIVEGGFWHSNTWEQNSSQSWLKTAVGYQLTDNIAVGAFYETGHVRRDIVDDQYGGFLRLTF